jgi:hypothetical protein
VRKISRPVPALLLRWGTTIASVTGGKFTQLS